MTIPNYLKEIEFAATRTIQTIWEDHNHLSTLEAELTCLRTVVEDGYSRAESLALGAEDPEDVAMSIGVHFETYFDSDKEQFEKQEMRDNMAQQIMAHAFSIDSLASALLQQAKQGISLAHGRPRPFPAARSIGTQSVAGIVWQGRNQSIHWEEGRFDKPVHDCFLALAREINPKFGDYQKRSMAFDVIQLLDWKDFKSFNQDMLTFA